jgi:hypothetical protein
MKNLKHIKLFEQFLNEGVHYTDLNKVNSEIKNNDGHYAIFKVQPEEKSAISDELKPHIGKFVRVESSHGKNNYTKVDSLTVWKENGDSFETTGVKINNLGEGGDLSFLELVAIVGPSNNPKKIKSEEGKYIDNPNYKPNLPHLCKVIKKY